MSCTSDSPFRLKGRTAPKTAVLSHEVSYLDVTPASGEVLGRQPPAAVVGLRFAAEQARAVQQPAGKTILDATLLEQRDKGVLVGGPVATVLAIGIEQLSRRRELGHFPVVHRADLAQEEAQ